MRQALVEVLRVDDAEAARFHRTSASSDKRSIKLIEHQDNMTRMGFSTPCVARTLITCDQRLTIYQGEDWGELYDLSEDPNESNNLWNAPSSAGARANLMERITQAMMDIIDQSPRARRRA